MNIYFISNHLRVIFDQCLKLQLGLDAISNQKILNCIYQISIHEEKCICLFTFSCWYKLGVQLLFLFFLLNFWFPLNNSILCMNQKYWNFLSHIRSIKSYKHPLNKYCHRSRDQLDLRKNWSSLYRDIHRALVYAPT